MSQFRLFHVSELMDRLNKVADIERYDQVTRNLQAFYAKKQEENPDAFFGSHHIQNTYSNFAGMNRESKFRDHFPDVFEQPKAQTSSTGRDATFIQEHETTASQPNSDFIRMSSLQKVKKVVESSLSIPQYKYNGYIKVANMGDSGFANWGVVFNTGKGLASVNVPVTIVDGYAYEAERFFTPSGEAIAFNKEELEHYAKTYSGSVRKVAEQKSGLTSLGHQSVMSESQIDYQNDVVLNNNISLSYSVPISEEFTAKMDATQQSLMDAISKARQEVEQKLSQGDKGTILNLTVNLSYSGAMPYDEVKVDGGGPDCDLGNNVLVPVETENVLAPLPATASEMNGEDYDVVIPEQFNGVIAFNISNKTRNGVRTATIPVEVIGNKATASNFYVRNGIAMKLDPSILNEYLNSEEEISNTSDNEQDAFSDAFLASDMSLNQLRKEMKQSIDGNNIARANACLSVIASRFGQESVQSVTKEYLTWVREASDARSNETNCVGCAFLESPTMKHASHTVAFCRRLTAPVSQIRRGSSAPNNCEKGTGSINWVNESDDSLKTSSIIFSQSYE